MDLNNKIRLHFVVPWVCIDMGIYKLIGRLKASFVCGLVFLFIFGCKSEDIESVKYTLSIIRPANGVISSNAIICGDSSDFCEVQFDEGSSVMLTAEADTDYAIGDWGDACESSDSRHTCELLMNEDKIVTKTFLETFTNISIPLEEYVYNYGKLAQWNFEEEAGNPSLIKDELGSFDTHLVNEVTYIVDIVKKRRSLFSLNFSSTNHKGQPMSSNASFNPQEGSLSVSFWFKTDVNTNQMVLQKGNNSNSEAGYSAFIVSNGSICWRISDGNNNASIGLSIQTGKWQHFSGVIDRENDILEATIDGNKTGSTFGCGNAGNSNNNLASFGAITNTKNLLLGSQPDGNRHFTGQIDKLIIFERVITPIEAKAAAQQRIQTVGHWLLDNTAADSSVNGLHGDVSSSPPTFTSNEEGISFARFDASKEQYIDLTTHLNTLKDMQEGTVSVWVRTNDRTNIQAILTISNSNESSSGAGLFLEGGTPRFNVHGSGVELNESHASHSWVINDIWQHLAVGIDSHGTHFFVNGKKVDQGVEAYHFTDKFFSSVPTPDNMVIGRNQNDSGGQWYFNGDIADVRIDSLAVNSPADIEYLFGDSYKRMGKEIKGTLGPHAKYIDKVEDVVVFEFYTSGGDYCYRIPAIVEMNDNNGEPVLMAFAERREDSCDDHGIIDIVMKSSRDGGETWSNSQVMAETGLALQQIPSSHTKGRYKVTGNPAPFVYTDPNNSNKTKLGLVFNTSTWSEWEVRNRTDTRRYVWFKSFEFDINNDLVESDAARNITSDVTKDSWNHWLAMTPGHAVQLSNGIVAIAGNHTIGEEGEDPDGSGFYPHMTYFDPANMAFSFDDNMAPRDLDGGNESIAAEFMGHLVVSIRNHGRVGKYPKSRFTATKDLDDPNWMTSLTWMGYQDAEIIDPVVQGSILNFKDLRKERLILTNPNNPDERKRLTVRVAYGFKEDGRLDWSRHQQLIHGGGSLYSDLTMVSSVRNSHVNNSPYIGSLYEHQFDGEEEGSWHLGIYFTKYNIEWVTDGYDTFEE